ncbi:hypothetical protein [Aliidiomarina quisquiliarum]|uniref:hypothetical protein n=1 Tax=Aliidiomarina quisquiliarum TaxID=2938947 RepID=UPI00208E2EE9|nr:hypothetical protein [Aliidiomarina quisquiliarum]MCO4320954.1 hypothetical protein [Aliidiomarina quisquiliarum]
MFRVLILVFGLAAAFTASASNIECLTLNEEVDFEVQLAAKQDHANCFFIDEQYAGYEVAIITETEGKVAHSVHVRSYNSSNDSPQPLVSTTSSADGVSTLDYIQPSGGSDFRVFAGENVSSDLNLRLTFMPFNGEAFVFLTISPVQ